jgi:hypothetical protein
MALVIRISPYQELSTPDTLDRTWAGYFPGMTEEQAYEAGRGVWTLGPQADDERFAMIVAGHKGAGTVRAVVEIDEIHNDKEVAGKRYFTGRVLPAGHPLREAYLGQPDPSGSTSQNPIAYARNLPEEEGFLLRDCLCGCGAQMRRAFAPGHDQRAINDRVARYFGGSAAAFIQWIDANTPEPGGIRKTP